MKHFHMHPLYKSNVFWHIVMFIILLFLLLIAFPEFAQPLFHITG